MPHFFLMDELEMEETDALQLRARLHIRSFWTLMRHGKYAHGITILYDAFESAVRRFRLLYAPNVPTEFLDRVTLVYKYLVQDRLIKYNFDLESFENLVTRALKSDFDKVNPDFDFQRFWTDIENAFRELEIVPFDFESLPEEDEATRKVLGLK